MTPNIRLAEPSDLDDLVRLLTAQFEEHEIPTGPGQIERAARGLIEEPRRGALLIAHADGRAVGVAWLSFTWTLEHGGLAAWLEELYVEPEQRSHGVGRALLHAAIAHVKAAGGAAVDLEVVEGHERAARLYQREGFQAHKRSRWVLKL